MQGGKWLETSPLWCIWRLLHLVQKKICENIVQAININWKLIPIANWPWKKWSLLMIPPNFSWELTSTLSSFFKIGTSTFVVETNYTNFLLNTIRFARSFVSNNSLLRNPQQTPVATPNKSRWYTLYVHNIWIVLFTAVLYDESLELLELLLRINFSFVFVEISFLAMVICPCQNGASGARKINRDRFYKSNNPQIWWIWSNLFSRFITNFRNCSFYRLNWRQTLKISTSLWHIHCEKYIVRFYQGVFFWQFWCLL